MQSEIKIVTTNFGPIRVTEHLLAIWNKFGYPRRDVLQRMAAVGHSGEKEARDASWPETG